MPVRKTPKDYHYDVVYYHHDIADRTFQVRNRLDNVLNAMNSNEARQIPGMRFAPNVTADAKVIDNEEALFENIQQGNTALLMVDDSVDDEMKMRIAGACDKAGIMTVEMTPPYTKSEHEGDDHAITYHTQGRRGGLMKQTMPQYLVTDPEVESETSAHMLTPLFAMSIMTHHNNQQATHGRGGL